VSGGLGLDLAIARQLVEIHGGTLTASSAGAWRAFHRQPAALSSAQSVTSRSRGTRLPLIAISARVVETSRKEALAAGFDRYVGKPLDMDELVFTIAVLVNARAA